MNESQFTGKLLVAIRHARHNAVVIKLADRFTSGIPDFFVSEKGKTTFCEVKLTTNPHIFEPLQLETCRRMGAYYLIWSPPQKRGYIFLAVAVGTNKAWTEYAPRTFEEIVEYIVRAF